MRFSKLIVVTILRTNMIESEKFTSCRDWDLKLPVMEHYIFRSFPHFRAEHLCGVIFRLCNFETEKYIPIFQVNSRMMEHFNIQ